MSLRIERLPFLTVVVPVFNRIGLVGRCLDSIRQSYAVAKINGVEPVDIDLVIVDDGSTDGTLGFVTHWAENNITRHFNVKIISCRHVGASGARAAAQPHIRSPFVYFFDSDDILSPDAIQTIVWKLIKYPRHHVLVFDGWLHRPGKPATRLHPRGIDLLTTHFHHATLSTQTMVMHKDALLEVGGWNPEVKIWNDWELGLRLLLAQKKIKRTGSRICHVYPQPDSITGPNFSSNAQKLTTALNAAEKAITESSHPRRDELLRLMGYKYIMLAAHFHREGHPGLSNEFMKRAAVFYPLSKTMRLLAPAIHRYISRGGRGASRLISPLLR